MQIRNFIIVYFFAKVSIIKGRKDPFTVSLSHGTLSISDNQLIKTVQLLKFLNYGAYEAIYTLWNTFR